MNPSGLFTDTMDVYAGSYVSVASAGAKRSEALRQAAVACRIEDVGADQQLVNLSLGVKVTHRIFTLYAGVQNGDTAHVNGGDYYRVIGTNRRRAIGNMDSFYSLDVEEIKA